MGYTTPVIWSFNKIMRVLILTDLVIWTGWGFILPIFAVFVLQSIVGGSVFVVGLGNGIFFITKSLLQVPIGAWLDRNHGEHDDFWAMFVGMFLTSLVPLGYIFISQPWQLYLLEALYGVGLAMAIPAWGGIFTRHIDKGKEAQTWGAESSLLNLGMGIAGIVGGAVAVSFGFVPLFLLVSLSGVVSTFGYLLIRSSLAPKGKTIVFPK